MNGQQEHGWPALLLITVHFFYTSVFRLCGQFTFKQNNWHGGLQRGEREERVCSPHDRKNEM